MNQFDDLDHWFSDQRPRKSKKATKISDLPMPGKSSSSKYTKSAGVDKLLLIAGKKPEVLVKLRSSTKSQYQLKTHFKYVAIREEGELVIENQDGDLFQGEEDINYLCEQWKAFGYPQYQSKVRESFHFIFSMPPGTNPLGELNAVREMAKIEFKGHKYTLVQHLDEDHPHVHVCVMALNEKGKRLNPRKGDLQRYRETFAEKLRDYGIEANASRRYQRFKSKRPENNKLRQMRERGAKPRVYAEQAQALKQAIKSGERPINPAIQNIENTQIVTSKLYLKTAEALKEQGRDKDSAQVKAFVSESLSADKRSLPQVQFDYLQRQIEKSKEQGRDKDATR